MLDRRGEGIPKRSSLPRKTRAISKVMQSERSVVARSVPPVLRERSFLPAGRRCCRWRLLDACNTSVMDIAMPHLPSDGEKQGGQDFHSGMLTSQDEHVYLPVLAA